MVVTGGISSLYILVHMFLHQKVKGYNTRTLQMALPVEEHPGVLSDSNLTV